MKDKYLIDLQKYVKNYLKNSNINNVVIGLSGGIDSSVSLAILNDCLDKKQIFAYFIDIESSKNDLVDAKKICDQFKIKLNYIDLTKSYNKLINSLSIKNNIQKANLKSRLRMLTLYNMAYENKAIVIGNSNLDELFLGYFTKFGDNACDLNLLSGLLKKDIYEYALYYKLPKSIITKKPSSGLIDNICDEDEIGVSYNVVDDFLLGKKINKKHQNLILNMHNKNKHKLIYNKYITKSKKYRKI